MQFQRLLAEPASKDVPLKRLFDSVRSPGSGRSDSPLPQGRRLGTYEILEQIGAGGMGDVYRAHDTRLRRDVAIKILPTAFTTDSSRLARF